MKKVLILLFAILALASCVKDDETLGYGTASDIGAEESLIRQTMPSEPHSHDPNLTTARDTQAVMQNKY